MGVTCCPPSARGPQVTGPAEVIHHLGWPQSDTLTLHQLLRPF